jgi:hypothetical protein
MLFHWLKVCESQVLRIVGGLVSVGIERNVIIVVLHYLLVGYKKILETISYHQHNARLG